VYLREKARGANEFILIYFRTYLRVSSSLLLRSLIVDVTFLILLYRFSIFRSFDWILERLLIILLRPPFRHHAPRNLRTLEILISQFPLNRYGTLFVGTSFNCRD